jgi:predicted dienelactone hydrolase
MPARPCRLDHRARGARAALAAVAVVVALPACGDDPPADPTSTGCDGAALLPRPVDPAARGPWPVGARTVAVGRLAKVEVWYPATPGSEVGQPAARYDIREALPPAQRDTIPDADNPWQTCACARDLPLDVARGPYPAVVFVHGTAAFRHQSLSLVTHWASRGFVVVAADHPGLLLGDLLALICGGPTTGARDLDGDVVALTEALAAPAGELGFLAGHIDGDRLAVAGHSAGGGTAADAATLRGVRAVVSLAGNTPALDTVTLEQVLFMSGERDRVVPASSVRTAWESSATPRYLVSLANAGHLAFSDLCATTNADGEDLVEIGRRYQLCGVGQAGMLFDCADDQLAPATGWTIVDHATTSVLERALQCRADLPPVSTIADVYPDVAAYAEAP